MQDFATFLNHPDIEGVYETKVPLLYRALMDMGCCVRLRAGRLRDGKRPTDAENHFRLEDFVFKSTSESEYLKDGSFQVCTTVSCCPSSMAC